MTERCTHQCRYCYNYFRHDSAPCHTLTRRDLEILVDEVAKNKIGQITITGGEPLIAADNVTWLAHQLSSFPWVRLGFNSNLVLFTEVLGKKLQQAGINSVLTSLIADDPKIHDKVAECPGSWKKTVEAIKLAKKLSFRIMANMVLTKWNVDRVYQTGKLAVELGVDKFGATRACAPTPIVNTFQENLISVNELRQSLETLYQLREDFGCEVDVFEHYPWCALQDIEKYQYLARRKCTAGVTSATIGANGQLRPCGHSPREYGSVLEHGPGKVDLTWLVFCYYICKL